MSTALLLVTQSPEGTFLRGTPEDGQLLGRAVWAGSQACLPA